MEAVRFTVWDSHTASKQTLQGDVWLAFLQMLNRSQLFAAERCVFAGPPRDHLTVCEHSFIKSWWFNILSTSCLKQDTETQIAHNVSSMVRKICF